jgi:uncharacterized protein YebE (UPF0316 family)
LRGLNYLRFFLAIPLILIGSILVGLTIDDIGDIGNIIMHLIGFGCLLGAIVIGRSKKEKLKKQS